MKKKGLIIGIIIYFVIMIVAGVIFFFVNRNKEEKNEEWIAESAEKIDKEITSGQFVLNDVVYTFPMDLQYWLDNGWHISKSYDNVDEFELEPGASCTEFELWNDDEQYVKVTVKNTSSKNAKVQDCMVNYLYMSLTEVDAIFPSGMSKRNKPADIFEAYGEPTTKEDSNGYIEAVYSFSSEDDWNCLVELDVVDNNYTIDPFSSVKYSIIQFDSIWDEVVATEGKDVATAIFMDATMQASYWGKFEDYTKYCIDSSKGGESLYESEYEYFTETIIYYLDLDTNYLSDEMRNRIVEVAKKALSKVEWEMKDVEINTFDQGSLIIELSPTNFFTVTEAALNDAIDKFSSKYEGVDFESMSDEDYAQVEIDYTTFMIEALESCVDDFGTSKPIEKEFKINMKEAIISHDDWYAIDDLIMGIEQ